MTIKPIDPTQLRAGMEVIGADGALVGHVKKVGSSDFVVDRSLQPDVTISFGFIRFLEAERIVLTVSADRVRGLDWRRAI